MRSSLLWCRSFPSLSGIFGESVEEAMYVRTYVPGLLCVGGFKKKKTSKIGNIILFLIFASVHNFKHVMRELF